MIFFGGVGSRGGNAQCIITDIIHLGGKNKWGLMLVKVKAKKLKRKERILDTLRYFMYIREEECASNYDLVNYGIDCLLFRFLLILIG